MDERLISEKQQVFNVQRQARLSVDLPLLKLGRLARKFLVRFGNFQQSYARFHSYSRILVCGIRSAARASCASSLYARKLFRRNPISSNRAVGGDR